MAGALAAPLPATFASATEAPAPDSSASASSVGLVPEAGMFAPGVTRVGGADRYDVSAATSTNTFPNPGVKVAYVVSGEVFADALSASALAGGLGGPVLLTRKADLPGSVSTELARLQPKAIVVLGGENSVSASVYEKLADYTPAISRIGGADRYEVSAAASAAAFYSPLPTYSVPVAYVASGESFPDALSGSASAAHLGGPVLLTRKGEIPGSVRAELMRLRPKRIVVLGGAGTIDESVVTALREIQPASFRLAGSNRYETSVFVSQGFDAGVDTVVVASGAVYPDALSGGPTAIAGGGPVVLVDPAGISPAVHTELTRLAPKRIVVLGGPNTVPQTVVDALAAYVRP